MERKISNKPEVRTNQFFGFLLYIVSIFFVSLGSALAQTPIPTVVPTHSSSQKMIGAVYPNWGRIRGLADFFPPKLFSALKTELKLTDEQIEAAKHIQKQLVEDRQRESHDSRESMPWDPKDKKAFQDQCEAEIVKFRSSLGDSKFDDFCHYVQEETVIITKIENPQSDPNNPGGSSDGLFKEITNSNFYKTYKQKRTAMDFAKHEKGLKLRISYEMTFRTPASAKKEYDPNKTRNGKKGRKQELDRILNELQNIN